MGTRSVAVIIPNLYIINVQSLAPSARGYHLDTSQPQVSEQGLDGPTVVSEVVEMCCFGVLFPLPFSRDASNGNGQSYDEDDGCNYSFEKELQETHINCESRFRWGSSKEIFERRVSKFS
jgi:hypothetical protein